MNKWDMLTNGIALAAEFCRENGIAMPEIEESDRPAHFGTCAYYRPTTITITVSKCAAIGTAGRAWSFPGYAVDRTPYGVIAHELGHHVDAHRGANPPTSRDYYSEYSRAIRAEVKEAPITTYLGGDPRYADAEWFAEAFRLFVTNHDLLRLIRPRTHARLLADFKPVERRPWEEVMAIAPERTINACRNRIAKEIRP